MVLGSNLTPRLPRLLGVSRLSKLNILGANLDFPGVRRVNERLGVPCTRHEAPKGCHSQAPYKVRNHDSIHYFGYANELICILRTWEYMESNPVIVKSCIPHSIAAGLKTFPTVYGYLETWEIPGGSP